jgi:single-strand DNA-binding protein
MPSLNKVEIIGHVGKDPEMNYTPSGAAVCKFSVATSEKWTDKASGEKKERTEWHYIQAWGKQADICGQYIAKGMLVYVSGSLRTSSWDDKDGVKRYKTEVNADKVLFLSGKSEKPNPDPIPGKPADDEPPF